MKFKEILFFVFFILSLASKSVSSNVSKAIKTRSCLNVRDANVENGGQQNCDCTYKIFREHYASSSLKLTSLMEKLKAWNCSQFQYECENRNFNFNRFTFLVYEKFCNNSNFERLCETEYRNRSNGVDILPSENSIELVVSSPCLQVFSYQYGKPFYEIVNPVESFCVNAWCGFSNSSLKNVFPSSWMCFPNNCRVKLITIMVACGILAVAIFIANLTIIIVILRNPRFPTSQLIYKLSLAFADILVGFFVVPTFISSLYFLYISPLERSTKNLFGNTKYNESNSIRTFDKDANVFFFTPTSQLYNDIFGFITFLSLFNSVFTLMFASVDRYRSLSHPLSFNQSKATLHAKRIIVMLWLLSIVFASLPILVDDLGPYGIVAGGVLIAVFGETSLFMMGIVLALPFFVMWIFTIVVQINLKRQLDLRKKQSLRQSNRDFNTEKQLSKTLTIMIAVFTACIFPALSVVFLAEFIPEVSLKNVTTFSKVPVAAFLSLELLVSIIFASNSLWNAFIYTFRHEQFRKDAVALYYAVAAKLKLIALKQSLSRLLSSRCLRGLPKKDSLESNVPTQHGSSSTLHSTSLKPTMTSFAPS